MNTDDIRNDTVLDFEKWRALHRSVLAGEYSLDCGRRDLFSGAVRDRRNSGWQALDIGGNHSVERTLRDIRRDSLDQYSLVFWASGRGTLIQNDRTTTLSMGDCALIDVATPFAYTVSERSVNSSRSISSSQSLESLSRLSAMT